MTTSKSDKAPPSINLQEARSRMQDAGLDAMIIASPANLTYAAGVQLVIPQNLVSRFHFAVLPREGSPCFLSSQVERWIVEEESWIEDIRTYGSLVQSVADMSLGTTDPAKRAPMDLLGDVLDEMGIATGTLGIETAWLPVYYHERLKRVLPQATFQSCDLLLKRLQSVKTAHEIDLLRHANYSMAKALHFGYETASEGDTEISVAATIAYHLVREGLEPRTFTMGSGPIRGGPGHPWPSSKRLEYGDIIHTDPKGSYRGYHGDVVRMACVGEPTSAQKRVYEKLKAIHEATIEYCRPGVSGHEVYHHCAAAFSREGMELGLSFVGHSLGVDFGHDPHLGDLTMMDGATFVLTPGMVFAIEPVFDNEDGRWHMEDVIVITEHGPEVLSAYPKGGQYLYVIE